MAKGQGERLIPMIQEMLDDHATQWATLDAIGVGIGPGNFTGIRISVAAARGLALALGVPAIGVSNFEMLHRAQAHPGEVDHLISLPQRAGSYLHHLRDGHRTGDATTYGDPLRPATAVTAPRGTVVLGAQAGEIAQALEQTHGQPVTFRDCALHGPDTADHIAHIAATRMTPTPERPAPLYVRAPDAAPPRDRAPIILP